MYRAKDQNRDQSYFLFSTTKEQLDFLRFPLGEIEKSQTREIAKKLNLNVVINLIVKMLLCPKRRL